MVLSALVLPEARADWDEVFLSGARVVCSRLTANLYSSAAPANMLRASSLEMRANKMRCGVRVEGEKRER